MLQIFESLNFWLVVIIGLLYWLTYRFGNPFSGR